MVDAGEGFPMPEGGETDELHPKSPAYWPHFIVHRRLEAAQSEGGNEKWVTCQGWDPGHQMDSRVHRYDREKGFYRGADHDAALGRNPNIRAAFEARRTRTVKKKSHPALVDRWSMFERWVLARMPGEPYAAYLRRAERYDDDLPFEPPPVELVVPFMDALRGFPLKANTIKTYISAISSICSEFGVGASSPCQASDVCDQMSTQACCKSDTDVFLFDTHVITRPLTPMYVWLTTMSASGY